MQFKNVKLTWKPQILTIRLTHYITWMPPLCLYVWNRIRYLSCKFKLDLEKAEEPEIKLPTSIGSLKKQESSKKNIYFCFTDYAKAFDCMDHNKLENFSRDGNTRPPDLPLEKSVCRSGSNSQNQTWNNRLVPNWERSMSRLYIVTLLI